ncbi:hypothetical protein V8C44DRAFT_186207 [Trichoderma aethiopicum]
MEKVCCQQGTNPVFFSFLFCFLIQPVSFLGNFCFSKGFLHAATLPIFLFLTANPGEAREQRRKNRDLGG